MTLRLLKNPPSQQVEKVLTQERLKDVLHYNPETGIFTWRQSLGGRVKCGGIAGSTNTAGYIQIAIDKKKYFAHRLAFLYMEGYIPENQVDHINRVRNDNSWCNLREVSQSCNMRNTSVCSNNISGVTGISWNKDRNKWRATIRTSGINKQLGNFKSFDDAVKARWRGEVKYGYPNCNSTSSAYQFLLENGLLTNYDSK